MDEKIYLEADKAITKGRPEEWEWTRESGMLVHSPTNLLLRVGCDDDGRLFVNVMVSFSITQTDEQVEATARGGVAYLREVVSGS